MKNDGYVKINEIMPYLLNTLAYWGGDDIYKALEKMPIESNFHSREKYVKKSNIMFYLNRNICYWGEDEVSTELNYIPTINGLILNCYKTIKNIIRRK